MINMKILCGTGDEMYVNEREVVNAVKRLRNDKPDGNQFHSNHINHAYCYIMVTAIITVVY